MKYIVLSSVILLFANCKSDGLAYHNIQGSTMGTTYNIILQCKVPEEMKIRVDDLLLQVNSAVSTYEQASTISIFNKNYSSYLRSEDRKLEDWFIENFDLSVEINKHSRGAFDPTVMPIVNYWGFGYEGKNKITEVDTQRVRSLMQHVGLEKLTKKNKKVIKVDSLVELDFSGVAKGYGVDKIGELLDSEGVSNYYVEVGGELFTRGLNAQGKVWRTGVSLPKEGSNRDEFQQIIEVSNKGIATSGNYRNFYESNGAVISHTINPKTGFPERSNILSATVIAPNCALADGYATACMVLGVQRAIEMIHLQKEIEGILVYTNELGELEVYDSAKTQNNAKI